MPHGWTTQHKQHEQLQGAREVPTITQTKVYLIPVLFRKRLILARWRHLMIPMLILLGMLVAVGMDDIIDIKGVNMKKILFFILAFTVIGCTQTVHLKYRWDKNTEADMSHYDLFTLTLPDSAMFWQLTEWPADTSDRVLPDTTRHYPHLLATVSHVHSAVDSMTFEFDHPMEQRFLRAYIIAVDSAGNYSPFGVSINVVYICDRDAPNMPVNYNIEF